MMEQRHIGVVMEQRFVGMGLEEEDGRDQTCMARGHGFSLQRQHGHGEGAIAHHGRSYLESTCTRQEATSDVSECTLGTGIVARS